MSNKIKSIKTFHVHENTDEKGIVNAYEERDMEGNVTLHIQYNEKGEIEQKTERILNGKGQLVEEKQFTGGENPDQHFIYEYNESGKVATAKVHYLDGSTSYRKYSRNESENTTTIEITDSEGDYEGKEFRRFDNEGRILEEIFYDEENKITGKTETEYDDYGRIIESVEMDANGNEIVRFFDFYLDEQGRVNKIETLNEAESVIRIDEFEFDERGNQIKHIIRDKSRGVFSTDDWDYDLGNKIINHKRYIGDKLMEEVKNRYRDDNLLAEQETLAGTGVSLNYYEYTFY